MFYPGQLEIRKRHDGARIVRGRFPYNKRAVLTDGGNKGRPVKEVFKPGAFKYRVVDPLADIHLLFGHSYDKPLASKLSRTLTLTDTAVALIFEAIITPQVMQTSYAKDVLALVGAGLTVGLSPGFRIPPKKTVPDAETITDEDPAEGRAIIRTINDCLLYELSIVTCPAYADSHVETDDEDEADDEAEDEQQQPVEAEARANLGGSDLVLPKPSIINPAYRWRYV